MLSHENVWIKAAAFNHDPGNQLPLMAYPIARANNNSYNTITETYFGISNTLDNVKCKKQIAESTKIVYPCQAEVPDFTQRDDTRHPAPLGSEYTYLGYYHPNRIASPTPSDVRATGETTTATPVSPELAFNIQTGGLTIGGVADADQAENGVYTGSATLSGAIGAVEWKLGGDDGGRFALSDQSTTGVTVTLQAQNYEAPGDRDRDGVYEYTLTATDAYNNIASTNVSVTITNVKEQRTLTFSGLPTQDETQDVRENEDEFKYSIAVSGAVSDVTWTLSGDDADVFELSNSNWFPRSSLAFVDLRLPPQDYENPKDTNKDNIYDYALTATDADDNTVSFSKSVVILNVINEATPPPAAPTGLAIEEVGETMVKLKWDNPNDANITGYQLLYAKGSSVPISDIWRDISGSNATTTTHTVTGLTGATQYAFSIRAKNDKLNGDIGNSPRSTVTATTEAVLLSTNTLEVNQGGSGTFNVKLAAEPSGTVTVALSSEDNGVTITPTTLTFTSDNYNQTQTIQATKTTGGTATIKLNASGGGYDDSLEKSLTLRANALPSFGTETVVKQSYIQDTAIATLTLPVATGGDDTLSYALRPALPTGLSFNASNRTISGTPTAAQAETEYTYTVRDQDGDTAELTFKIEVEADATPSFGTATIAAQSYIQGVAIATLTLPEASGGNGTLSYSLTPPAGLSFDAASRELTGTPSAVLAETEYTYTVTDVDGDAVSLTFTIEVVADATPSFSGATIDAQSYIQGVAIATLTLPEASGGNGTLSYSLTPPAGLSFNTTTRDLTGTPSALVAETEYTYTVTDVDGDAVSLTFTIEVVADVTPSFGSATIDAQSYIQGVAIATLTLPEASGGNGTLSYSFTPPAGLSFDASTRELTGTPSTLLTETEYTYTVTDVDGDTAELKFNIEVVADVAPSFGTATIDAQSYIQGVAIATLTLPEASGGNGTLIYSLTPPAGLSFDAATRELTGTPSAMLAETEYTYTATDVDGDTAELKFNIEVVADATPSFGSAAIDAQSYINGVAIATLTLPEASGGNGTLSYSLTPPAGLSFNTATRELTGTPSAVLADTEYTYIATDVDGDTAELKFNIEVVADATPSFGSATIDAQSYIQGVAIATLTLPEASGGNGTLSYSLTPPAGLSFDAASRELTGTPSAVLTETEYTYTVTDVDGDTAELTFNIEVVADATPSFGSATIDAQSYIQGVAIATLTLPEASGGNGTLSYSLTPPAGLSFDASTRELTGTPSAVLTETEYIYTATDVDGDTAELKFNIEVVADATPSFGSVTIDAQSYIQGVAIATLTLPEASGGNGTLSYSLTPPAGLSFDAATRELTGTPSAVLTETEYTYTATDMDGDTAELTFNIEVVANATPSFGSATIDAQSYIQGVAIATLTLPEASGGNGTLSYSLTPPAGLSFNAATRELTGTPSAVLAETEYTYTATDVNGDTAELTFTIEVLADATPSFGTATIDAQSYIQGVAIATLTLPEASGGNGTLSYSLTPPAGLSFDAATRELTGTPSAVLTETEYTYTATDVDGDTAELTFTIEVVADATPSFGSATIDAQSYIQGVAIATLTLPDASGGNAPLSYSLTPPAGLSFDAATRELTGTPSAVLTETEYTYTATDVDGDTAELTFNIEVVANAAPSFGSATIDAQSYIQGVAIASLTLPEASGGNGTLSYSLTPPAGLSFNAATRELTGTPSAVLAETEYTYTVTDVDGDTAELTFTIEVVADATPSFGSATIDAQSYIQGVAIATLTLPEASGGNGTLSYSLTPPAGLSFDAATRELTGTPSALVTETEYTYTVTDVDGDTAELTFDIEVLADATPSFGAATIAAQSYIQGVAIASLTLPEASGGNGTLSYSLTPPAGLSFNAATRELTGTPSAVLAETEYTYTVTDVDGDTAELTFTIEVVANATPSFGTATIAAQSYIQGVAIQTLTLPEASGGNGTLSYSLTPPAGLSFNTTTRELTGTPSAVLTETEYTYTVTDVDGDTAELTFTIEVAADTTPSFGTATIAAQSYSQSLAIATLTLPEASGGNAPLSYSLTPPAGLIFDAITRELTGTPTDLQAATQYTYTVTDANGDTAELTFTIEVVVPPQPNKPTGLTATAGDAEVTLAWADPGNASITKYQLRYGTHWSGSVPPNATWVDIPNSADGEENALGYTVTGLTNGVLYAFQIRAVNAGGESDASDEVTAFPLINEQTPAPTITSVGPGSNDGDLDIKWSWSPGGSRCEVRHYSVQYKKSSVDDWNYGETQNDVNRGIYETVVREGLGAGVIDQIFTINEQTTGHNSGEVGVKLDDTSYDARVFVYSYNCDEHSGMDSDGQSGRPLYLLGKPTSFTATPGNGKVTLAATVVQRGPTIQKWQYSYEEGNWTDIPDSASTSISSKEVTGLTNGTYTFKVRGVHEQGAGVASDEVMVTLVVSEPVAPTGLTANMGDTAVTLSWDDPQDATITGYQVRFAEGTTVDDSTAWTAITGSGASTTNHTVTGLTNGTQYTFQIRAVNNRGNSAPATVTVTPKVNNPPTVANTIAAQTVAADATVTVELETASSEVFTDPDGDPLSYTASSSDTTKATVAVAGSVVTVAGAAAGDVTITVTASDGKGGTQDAMFNVTVTAFTKPTVENPIADLKAAVNKEVSINLAGVFVDPNGDTLSYEVSSSDTSKAAVVLNIDNTVTVTTSNKTGTATITVTASDPDGNSVSDEFNVTVLAALRPAAPVITSLTPGVQEITVNWTWTDDTDGACAVSGPHSALELYYKKSSLGDNGWQDPSDDLDNTTDHGTFEFRGSIDDLTEFVIKEGAKLSLNPRNSQIGVALDPVDYDVRMSVYSASETCGYGYSPYSAVETTKVKLGQQNSDPTLANPISDQWVAVGSDMLVQLETSGSEVFNDVNGDPLTYTVSSGDTSKVSVAVDNDANTVTVTGVAAGATTITVTADDGRGGMVASDEFTVTATALDVTPTSLEVEEGSSDTFTVALAAAPSAPVTVTVASDDSDVTVNPTSLSFTTTNYATAQIVTVDMAADPTDGAATISLSASGGGYAGLTESVAVSANALPSFGTETIADQSYDQDTAITTLTLPEATGGNGTLTYTLTPAAPAGLTFDPTARTLSGTPTASLAETTYTYTATDDDGDAVSLSFKITIAADSTPSFGTKTIADQIYTQDTAITTLTLPEATGGNGTLTYTLTPATPTGLTFDTTARTLSGTPTASLAETTYTYTATDNDGDAVSLSFKITVATGNQAPVVVRPIPDSAARINDTFGSGDFVKRLEEVDEEIFSDGDGDDLTYSATSANPGVASIKEVDNGEIKRLEVQAVSVGTTEITLRATDPDGAWAEDRFNITVIDGNGSAHLSSFDDVILSVNGGGTEYINPPLPAVASAGATTFFDGNDLTVVSANPSVATAEIINWQNGINDDKSFVTFNLRVTAVGTGVTTISVTNDPSFDVLVTKTFKVTVTGNLAPAQPSNLQATPGDGQVTLNWDDPSDTSISKYQFRQAQGATVPDSTTWTDITGSGATTTSHTVSGLTNDTQYAFQLRAVNTTGDGATSTTVTATPTGTVSGSAAALQAPTPADTTAPTVTITTSDADLTTGETATVTVTFSEPVTGFTADELTASTGSLSGFTGSGAAYTATLTPPENAKGTITLSVAAGVAEDSAGNSNSAAPNTTLSYNTITIATASQEALEQVNKVNLPDVIHNTVGHHVEVLTARLDSIDPLALGQAGSPISMGLEEMGNAIASTVFDYGDELANGTVDWQQALGGRSFSFPAASISSARVIKGPDGMDGQNLGLFSTLSFWGRADYSSFSREVDHNNLQADTDGDTFTVYIGADVQPIPDLVTGLSLAFSRSHVDWDGKDGVNGTHTVNFTTVHPYVSWFAGDWQLWTSGLFGSGDTEWKPEGGGGSVEENGSVSGIAGGVRYRFWSSAAEAYPLSLSLKLDGATASFLGVDAQQARLAIEADRQFPIHTGELTGSLSLGLRIKDDSTYGTGTAVEVGAGTTWQGERLALNGQGRLLFGVGEQEWREWGISGTVLYSPGSDGEGVMVSLEPSIGVTSSKQAELWSLTGSDLALGSGQEELEPRLRAELAYGLRRGALLLTPYTELSITPSSNVYGIGVRYDLGRDVTLDLHGSHTAPLRGERDNSVKVDLNTQF